MATVTIMKDGAKPYVYEIPGSAQIVEDFPSDITVIVVEDFPSDITVIVDEWPPTIITTRNT